jgi:hypothetical protein
MRASFVNGFLGFLPGRNFDGDTGSVVCGNGESEDVAPEAAGWSVDPAFGVENAMGAA